MTSETATKQPLFKKHKQRATRQTSVVEPIAASSAPIDSAHNTESATASDPDTTAAAAAPAESESRNEESISTHTIDDIRLAQQLRIAQRGSRRAAQSTQPAKRANAHSQANADDTNSGETGVASIHALSSASASGQQFDEADADEGEANSSAPLLAKQMAQYVQQQIQAKLKESKQQQSNATNAEEVQQQQLKEESTDNNKDLSALDAAAPNAASTIDSSNTPTAPVNRIASLLPKSLTSTSGDEPAERWLTGVSEVPLTLADRMANIERTEVAKAKMQKAKQKQTAERKQTQQLMQQQQQLPSTSQTLDSSLPPSSHAQLLQADLLSISSRGNFAQNFISHKADWDSNRRREWHKFNESIAQIEGRKPGERAPKQESNLKRDRPLDGPQPPRDPNVTFVKPSSGQWLPKASDSRVVAQFIKRHKFK